MDRYKLLWISKSERVSACQIWDMCDNTAIVTTKTAYDASLCVRNLFSNERASINDADIDWDNAEE